MSNLENFAIYFAEFTFQADPNLVTNPGSYINPIAVDSVSQKLTYLVEAVDPCPNVIEFT